LFTLMLDDCAACPQTSCAAAVPRPAGFGGGGMVPVAQSILAMAFPPAKRGQALRFRVAVVVAPVVGPTLGGWIRPIGSLAVVPF